MKTDYCLCSLAVTCLKEVIISRRRCMIEKILTTNKQSYIYQVASLLMTFSELKGHSNVLGSVHIWNYCKCPLS